MNKKSANEFKNIITDMQSFLSIGGEPASLRDVAKFLGISHGTAANWVSGKAKPNAITAQYINNGTKAARVAAEKISALVEVSEDNEKALS